MVAHVLPQLPHLQHVHFHCSASLCGSAGHAAAVSALQHLSKLTHINLGYSDLGDAGTLLVTPHMTQLQEVDLWCVKMSGTRWAEFFSSLQDATQLTHISLNRINLDDDCTLLVTPHMTQLKEVDLWNVKMSPRRLSEFVASLLTVQHILYVKLSGTNIDDVTVKAIHSSSHFSVTEEYLERNASDDIWRHIEFHTVQ